MDAFLITDIQGSYLNEDEKDWLKSPSLYGILLFARNYQNPSQLKSLIAQIKQSNDELKIFVDHEGGVVQRFIRGFTRIESMRSLGKLYETSSNEARLKTQKIAQIIASELTNVGIDVNFAPVVDCAYQINKGAIQSRAFSKKSEVVFELAKIMIIEFEKQGLKGTIKHFPGHGYSHLDSHFHFVKDDRSWEQLRSEMDIYPKLIDCFQGEISYLMLAHLVYPCFDDKPVFLSKKWIRYLRQVIDYQGIIVSDDLNMQAAKAVDKPKNLAMRALDAGCDLLILTHNNEAKKELLLLSG